MASIGSPRLYQNCLSRFPYSRFPKSVRATTHLLKQAAIEGRQIPLLSEGNPNFDQTAAYEISAANCALAIQHNSKPVGRKIGFTNTKIWSEYNVSEPNWGYLFDKQTLSASKAQWHFNIPATTIAWQPRIEPEIIFRLKKRPHSYMTEREALSCVEWISQGYEIVVSAFKDWKFTAADTTATNALHHRLFIGDKWYPEEKDLDNLTAQLQSFRIELYRDEHLVSEGTGRNVLGSPIKALLHLCRMLEGQILHPGLCPGEIITTGTLTKAMPISTNERWSTKIQGIDLPGLDLRFGVPNHKIRHNTNIKRLKLKT